MNTIKCGHISRSKDKINFFVNDINSLVNVIIPIFTYVNLNSSKYYHFELFKKAVSLTSNKDHLSNTGKSTIINYQKQMQNMSNKWLPESRYNEIKVTKN
jgi:hypothetical protein